MSTNNKIITVTIALISLITIWYLTPYASGNENMTTPTGFIRELSQIEQYKLFLANESFNSGVTTKDFLFLIKAIGKESDWEIDATNNNLHKDGTVSTDSGLCQINDRYWGDRAKELGLDYIHNVWDNLKMCVIVMKEQGRGAWVSMKRK